jgi:hypothetical protein
LAAFLELLPILSMDDSRGGAIISYASPSLAPSRYPGRIHRRSRTEIRYAGLSVEEKKQRVCGLIAEQAYAADGAGAPRLIRNVRRHDNGE